ncbi:MAG: TIGR00296 family protein [Nitrososphaeraceae archaeon]|nr:TIGR00296 family protein [Nitrososphaeraceae archaeon]
MILFTLKEGQHLVSVARDIVERLFNGRRPSLQPLIQTNVKAGVFVSIHAHSTGENILRGCVGFPLPRGEFYSSLEEAAIAAATQDPRFSPISKEELGKVIFEVSVLNRPELISVAKPIDYLAMVKIGVDGLMLSWGEHSSLLLPQVALEFNWAVDEFLSNLCHKAGLTPDMWMNKDVKIYKFSCVIFRESEPRGGIYRVDGRTSE